MTNPETFKPTTEREMLMFVYGALKCIKASYPDISHVTEELELFLFPRPIYIDPMPKMNMSK